MSPGHLSLPSFRTPWSGREGARQCASWGPERPLVLAPCHWPPSWLHSNDAEPTAGTLRVWDPSLFWGIGLPVVLDSFLGGGFFNFLKILPPFMKGTGEGEE